MKKSYPVRTGPYLHHGGAQTRRRIWSQLPQPDSAGLGVVNSIRNWMKRRVVMIRWTNKRACNTIIMHFHVNTKCLSPDAIHLVQA